MRSIFLLILAFLAVTDYSYSCTSAIVSGKYTADGRPLMWKHRDNDVPRSKLLYLSEGKYDMIVLVNATVVNPTAVWYGFNSAGFAIMNTMSYNIEDESTSIADKNGIIMREALALCSNIEEFEKFLDAYPKPMKVSANFGIIDAYGGAAYFEVNNESYIKIDVNDKKIAPHGYVVRTNYSFAGIENKGAGYIRFQTAEKLFYLASGSDNLNVPYLLENMCRSLENSYTGQDVRNFLTIPEGQDNYIYYQDCINRHTSTSSIIVQGVKPGESPMLTTMWAIIGTPLSSMVIPVWLNSNKALPEVITTNNRETPEVCDFSLRLKDIMVPSMRGSMKYYINTSKVFNANGTGITQQILPMEKVLVKEAYSYLDAWREAGRIDQTRLRAFYGWTDDYVRDTYHGTFGLGSGSGKKQKRK